MFYHCIPVCSFRCLLFFFFSFLSCFPFTFNFELVESRDNHKRNQKVDSFNSYKLILLQEGSVLYLLLVLILCAEVCMTSARHLIKKRNYSDQSVRGYLAEVSELRTKITYLLHIIHRSQMKRLLLADMLVE